jgi:hypothetical protein
LALTLNTKQKLADKSFPELYTAKTKVWKDLLENAVRYLDETFPPNENIRPEDLSEALMKVVAVTEEYRQHIETRKLREKRWAKDFSDYIVDVNYTKELVARKKGKKHGQ